MLTVDSIIDLHYGSSRVNLMKHARMVAESTITIRGMIATSAKARRAIHQLLHSRRQLLLVMYPYLGIDSSEYWLIYRPIYYSAIYLNHIHINRYKDDEGKDYQGQRFSGVGNKVLYRQPTDLPFSFHLIFERLELHQPVIFYSAL